MKKVAGTEIQPSTLNSNSIGNLLEESARDHQYTQLVIRLMDASDDHNRRLHSRSRDILRDSGLFTADQSAGVEESESTTANHRIRKSRHRLSRIFSQYVLITFLYRWHKMLLLKQCSSMKVKNLIPANHITCISITLDMIIFAFLCHEGILTGFFSYCV